MSWIFGIYGDCTEKDIDNAINVSNDHTHFYKNDKMCILSGGNPDTTFHIDSQDIFLCGIGIDKRSESYRISESYKTMSEQDWENHFNSNRLVKELNGHFIGLKYTKDTIELFNDTHAQRDIFVYQLDHLQVFSTRIDMLADFVGGLKFNIDVLSQQWQMPNILNYETIYQGVQRLGTSEYAMINSSGFSVKEKLYDLPDKMIDNPNETRRILSNLMLAPIDSDKEIALALSGGLDSRLLLSVLIGSGRKFRTIAFGDKNHPDNVIAKEISEAFSIPFENFDISDMSTHKVVELSKEYIKHTQLLASASNYKQFSHYNSINEKGYFVIDGGWGEIGRRGLYNLLLLRSKNNLSKGKSDIILRYIRQAKPQIFNQSITEKMRVNSLMVLDSVIDKMPDIASIGAEKWLDLFSIRTKLPNNGFLEQSRIDSYAMSYTPYIQPDFINYIQSLPLFYKKNATEFKRIISDLAPKLTEFPLIKGVNSYPYKFKTMQAKILVQLKKKLKNNYQNKDRSDYLYTMKDFVLDTISSTDFKNYDPYHHNGINKYISEYYAGNPKYGEHVDWFISFELLRQTISKH